MKIKWVIGFFFVILCQSALALSERHLMIIRHGEGECDIIAHYHSNPKHPQYKSYPLTDKGRAQIKEVSEILLSHGFDNRSIAAVYVSPLPRTIESAQLLTQIGVFTEDKIHIEPRLTEIQAGEREGKLQVDPIKETWIVGSHEAGSYQGESNIDVRKRVLALYDDVEKWHPTGHIIFITHGIPAMELTDNISKYKMKLALGQAYLLPLSKREKTS